jgi:release factor glutamine methyltransferase
MTPAEVLAHAARYLEAHGVDSPRRNAEVLLQHVLKTDRAGLYTRRDGLNSAQARAFGRALCQRCGGVPLQYLTGTQPFMGLELTVEPGVFVPRPETEVLVEAALRVVSSGVTAPLVVDIGTGTGAIALAIKRARPHARVLATDVSEAAVALARTNADRLGLEVEVFAGRLLEPVPGEVEGRLDLLVSNPPYVTAMEYETLPHEVKAEPYAALVGGIEVHTKLVELASSWLKTGGWLAVEIGAGQGPEVAALFRRRLAEVEVLPDLAGRDRVVLGRLSPPPGGLPARDRAG